MKIYYRISDVGYKKIKPDFVNNENCLKNFVSVFNKYITDIYIIADNICAATNAMVQKYIDTNNIINVNVGHGAGTFNIALDYAIKQADEEIVYFVENDYIHIHNSPEIIYEGLSLGFPYVTLYDHPDKYIDPSLGGNPFCVGGAEDTKVYLTSSCHWKITNSTTMTFATKSKFLKRDETTLRKWTSGTYPDDFKMFLELGQSDKKVISSIPGYCTHGESKWLSPLINWRKNVYS